MWTNNTVKYRNITMWVFCSFSHFNEVKFNIRLKTMNLIVNVTFFSWQFICRRICSVKFYYLITRLLLTDVLGCLQVTMVMWWKTWPTDPLQLLTSSCSASTFFPVMSGCSSLVRVWLRRLLTHMETLVCSWTQPSRCCTTTGWQQLLPLWSEWFSLLSFLWSKKWSRVWTCSHDRSPTLIISDYCQNIDQISASHGVLIFTV